MRKGNSDLLENVIVSVEKVAGSSNKVLYIRMPNKCIYFYGTIHPNLTEVSPIKENIFKNISVKKIVGEKDGKPAFDLLKIQFKEEKHGKSFVAACE